MGYRDGNYDVPDPGSQGGAQASRMTLRCVECGWSVSERPGINICTEAQHHYDATGHGISFRGTVQDCWPSRPRTAREVA